MADISLEKTLPHNLEAERSILGAVLLDDRALLTVFEIVKSQDFYLEGHRRVFEKMVQLMNLSQPIDLVTLNEELQRAGELESVGGAAYLASLTDGLPRALNIEHYARIVKDKSTLRRLIQISSETMSRSYRDEDPTEEILQSAEKAIYDISNAQFRSGYTPIPPIVSDVYKQIEDLSNRKAPVTGLETRFVDLDRMTAGLHPSDLIIVAARPGLGKTSLCLNIAVHLALRKRKTVGIFSLEMSKEQLVKRFLSSEARIDQQRINTGFLSKDDWTRLGQVSSALSDAKIFIDDTASINIAELRSKSRRLSLEHGLDLIIVDYLQLMSGTAQRYENRTQEIGQISRGLKGIAKDLDIPLIAVSQLSRAVESRRGDDRRPSSPTSGNRLDRAGRRHCLVHLPRGDVEHRGKPGAGRDHHWQAAQRPHRHHPLAFSRQFTKFDNLYQNSRAPAS